MNDILENELVKKYFTGEYGVKAYMADTILRAMQEPIETGERYLSWSEGWYELTATDKVQSLFHPTVLRLPDRFQVEKKECVEELHGPNCWHWEDESRKQGHWEKFCPNKLSEVEEKIKSMVSRTPIGYIVTTDEQELRALVDLVRKEGKHE